MSIRSRQAPRVDDEAPVIWGRDDLFDRPDVEDDDPSPALNPKQVKRLARRFIAWRALQQGSSPRR